MDLIPQHGRTRFSKLKAAVLIFAALSFYGCLELPDDPGAPPEIDNISVYVKQKGVSDSSVLKISPMDSATLKVSVHPRQYRDELSFEWYNNTKLLGKGKSYTIKALSSKDKIPTQLKIYDPLGSERSISFKIILNTPPRMLSITSPAAGDTLYGHFETAFLFKWNAYDDDISYGDELRYTLVIDKNRFELGPLTDIRQSGLEPGEHSTYVVVTDSYGDRDFIAPQKFFIIDTLGSLP